MSNDQVIQFRGTIYENGYGMLARKVMRDKDLSPTAKSIYAYICSFAGVDKDGKVSAFPGVSIKKEELGNRTDKTYYNHRKQLLKKGYISIEKNRKEGKFENNIYFIEPIPVETVFTTEEQNNLPHSNNYRTVKKPYSKKSSLIKEGTIITSSINTSKEEEEDNNKSENIFHSAIQNYLTEKNIEQKTINSIIVQLEQNDITSFTLANIEQQYEHMMKVMQHSRIYDFAKYFVNGLKTIIENENATRQYNQNLEQYKKTKANNDVYFNWLEQNDSHG